MYHVVGVNCVKHQNGKVVMESEEWNGGMTKLCGKSLRRVGFRSLQTVWRIGGGSIYKVGGPDAERRRCQRDGEGLRGGVRNLYQLFILK